MPDPTILRATVSSLESFGDQVYELCLRPETPLPPFRAGQFLYLALDEYDPADDWPDSRVFSIASGPSRRDVIRVLFAVKGDYTVRMAKELRPGASAWLKLPDGDFRFDADPGKRVVLIAGGTGVAPYLSFLEEAVDSATDRPVHLAYGARTTDLIVCRDQLEECTARLKNFTYDLFVESGDALPANAHSGPLDLDVIMARLDADHPSVYFLAGPPPMVNAFRDGLAGRGVAPEDIRVDAWE